MQIDKKIQAFDVSNKENEIKPYEL